MRSNLRITRIILIIGALSAAGPLFGLPLRIGTIPIRYLLAIGLLVLAGEAPYIVLAVLSQLGRKSARAWMYPVIAFVIVVPASIFYLLAWFNPDKDNFFLYLIIPFYQAILGVLVWLLLLLIHFFLQRKQR